MEKVARAIGYLVYAVASADKHVTPEEKQIVHDIINENWIVFADKEDPFGVRALDYVDKILLGLESKNVSSEDAFTSFKEVYTENREQFSPELKTFILDVCIKTGSAFNRLNKSELVLLSRIEQLLK